MWRKSALIGLAAILALAILATLGVVTANTSAAGSVSIAPILDPSTAPIRPNLEEGTPPSSALAIVKTADISSAEFGDDITFTLYVHNSTSAPIPALIFDPVADGTRYVRGTFKSYTPGTERGYDEDTNAIYWQGDVPAGTTVKITYKVLVVRCNRHGFEVTNVAAAYAYGQSQLPASSSVTVEIAPCTGRDLGDAPDSANHFGARMMAYQGTPAEFPTVFDHETGTPPGPLHHEPAAVHLGRGVSFEREADLPPDQDDLTNLLPVRDDDNEVSDVASLAGIADLDGFDDGVHPPATEPCEAWVDLPVTITVNDPTIPQSDGLLYLNIWVDGNHNGRWGDIIACDDGQEAFEWVLQDFEIPMSDLVAGTQVVNVTTKPVYREEDDGGILPAWMRITLSDSPAPHNPDSPHVAGTTQADGRGPEAGWELGETEDYLLPGTHRPPVGIEKTANKTSVALGDEVEYKISLTNPTTAPATVLMYDQIPDAAEYVDGTYGSSIPGIREGYVDGAKAVFWYGIVPGNETVDIVYAAEVVRCHPEGFPLLNTAWAYDHEVDRATAASVRVEIDPCTGPDLGDAPDSSNHFGDAMTAYPAVPAEFPTVWDPATGTPPGPKHHNAVAAHLGRGVSFERDADLKPDQDGVRNLHPPSDVANRDRFDDAFVEGLPEIAPCASWENLPVAITVNDANILESDTPLYLNMWVDGNYNGTWTDTNLCGDNAVPEWVLQNHAIPRSELAADTQIVEVTTLPVYRTESTHGLLPAWLRITLSEGPVPIPATLDIPDGSGPEDGWDLGETEDYYLPGDPAISIDKVADREVAAKGDEILFTVTLSNASGEPAHVTVYDLIPPGTEYIPSTYHSTVPAIEEGYDVGTRPDLAVKHHWIVWRGDVPGSSTVEISFKVRVIRCAAEGFRVVNDAWAFEPGLPPVTATAVVEVEPCHAADLGDAPDSTNHFNTEMRAYPDVAARFPTVFDAQTGTPPGPIHRRPRADAWLGYWVSGEEDADLMPDEDGLPNLKPPDGKANQDRHDDGLVDPIRLPHCERTEIKVLVHVPGPTPAANSTPIQQRYINVWFDWNRDGDWQDVFKCANIDGGAPEWAVRDHLIALEPGLHDVTLPAFLPFNPTPHLNMWARVTLSEQPAPRNPDTNLADGRGPAEGYAYGETEDYLIPGQHHEPEFKIYKAVDKLHASPGDELQYTIAIENGGNTPAAGAHMEDEIPDDTAYVEGSLSSSKPEANYAEDKVTWHGDVEAGETVTVSFKVRVKIEEDVADVAELRCEGGIRNRAVLVLSNGISMTSEEVHTRILCPDLGDAPDSTNHHGATMTTYPSAVTANFPTVYDPASGLPQGPIHWKPTQDAWLGPHDAPPSGERDADLKPDQDGRPNIDPLLNKADQDRHDNGVFRHELELPHCEPATVWYQVTIVGSERERFVNVWFDWNRDGDWEDVLDCPNAPAPEWAVQNEVIALGPGTHVLSTKTFLPHHPEPGKPDDPTWMRITLAERPVGADTVAATLETIPTDGSGPVTGYRYGETEDYLLGHIVSPEPPDVWVTKELRHVDFDDTEVDANRHAPARFFFHLEYGNSGGSTAKDVVVADTLPISTTYKGSRSVPDIEPPAVVTPTVSWNAGTLNPGDHGFIDVWFHVPAAEFHVLPPGTVLTNTATISTTTPGDDPANNTSIITGTIPLLPPRITWPIPGTTCTNALTVTGKSWIGTFVDLYVDGVYTATATVDTTGNWEVPLTLTSGSHGIYAEARTAAGKVSDPSPTVVVIVDESLVWDPMSMTFTTVAPNGFVRTQHIRTEEGRADPDGWSVFLPTRPGVTQQYTATVRICCDNPTDVTLTVSGTVYAMTATGDGWYQTLIDAPGAPNAPITLTVNCGGVTSNGSGSGLIDPDGYIFDVDVGKDAGTLSGLTVTAMEYDSQTQSWDRWPAELYESQTNPQVTAADGYYSFYTPPGDYQITVDASAGYQGYRSWTLTVISTPVHLDIPLTKAYVDTDYAITVDATGFVPDSLEVAQGSVVQWKNIEASEGVWHTTISNVDARSNTSGWDSGLLDSGESFSRRFDTLGTFTYYDYENPSLVATIKVCYLYDFDCDSKVGAGDIQGVAQLWHTVSGQGNGYDARYDIDGDGQINIIDIQKAATAWGWTAP